MPPALPERPEFNTPALLDAFFERSQDGFFFMMLDEPIEWGPGVDKDAVLDYVFSHQRMTKVNPAMAEQFRASAAELIGLTPSEFFRHDLAAGRRGWRALFDAGHTHNITNERRLDGSTMWVEGDYMCFYDATGRITGHFGIQRDVTDRTLAAKELEQSRAELRALAARLQETREEERTRIAREIHDELGQALTALKLDLAWLGIKRPRENSGAYRLLDASITTRIDETMQVVRRIASELRPSVLDQLGLEAALEWQGQEFGAHTGIEVTMDLCADECAIPEDLGSTVFRILQESLTNVARHARAKRVTIRLIQTVDRVTLEVSDDGIGIPPERLEGTASLGLLGMRERALACGGELTITGQPSQGTTVLLTVPLSAGVAR